MVWGRWGNARLVQLPHLSHIWMMTLTLTWKTSINAHLRDSSMLFCVCHGKNMNNIVNNHYIRIYFNLMEGYKFQSLNYFSLTFCFIIYLYWWIYFLNTSDEWLFECFWSFDTQRSVEKVNYNNVNVISIHWLFKCARKFLIL